MDQVFLQDFILIQGHPIINLQRRKRLPVPTSGNLHQINARQTKILFSWSILCAQHFPLPCNITTSKTPPKQILFVCFSQTALWITRIMILCTNWNTWLKCLGKLIFCYHCYFLYKNTILCFTFLSILWLFFFEYGEIFFTIDDYPQYCDNHRIVTRSYRIHIFVIHMSWKSGIILQSVQWTDLCFQGILLAWKKKLLSSKDIARLVPIKT